MAEQSKEGFENLYRVPYLMGIEQSQEFKIKREKATKIVKMMYGKIDEEQVKQAPKNTSRILIQWEDKNKIKCQKSFSNGSQTIQGITNLSGKLSKLMLSQNNNRFSLTFKQLSEQCDKMEVFLPIYKSLVLSQGLVISLQEGLEIRVNKALHMDEPTNNQYIYLNKIIKAKNQQQVELSLVFGKKNMTFDKDCVTYLANSESPNGKTKIISKLKPDVVVKVYLKDKKYWCLQVQNTNCLLPKILLKQCSSIQISGGKVQLHYIPKDTNANPGKFILQKQ